MNNEKWADIKGYEGSYQISNMGRVKSLKRKINSNNGGKYVKNESILTPIISSKGYYRVSLSKDSKTKIFSIHRLVAESFIQNTNNLPQVNHKDENKLNNNVDNLEWCDNKYNLRYSCSKKVIRSDKYGNEKIYDCMSDVVKDGFSLGHVSNCCNGRRKTHKGFEWRFER